MTHRHASIATLLVLLAGSLSPAAQPRRPLSSADIDDIATLLKLEDIRQFDEGALGRILQSAHPEVRRRAAVTIGRIADARGAALLEQARVDNDIAVAASYLFAIGQLRLPAFVEMLSRVLSNPAAPAPIAREAAQALGKIQVPKSRAALAKYLAAAPATAAAAPVVGEALLSWGRFSTKDDLSPVVRWASSPNVEVRWRAAWALFRPRDPAAIPHLMKLVADASGDVRFWAVRGLIPAAVDAAAMDRAVVTERLQSLFMKDSDRRVRTEALRTLLQYDDTRAFDALMNGLRSTDAWIAGSAAEVAGRFGAHAAELTSRLLQVATATKSTALRTLIVTALVTLAPSAKTTIDLAASLAKEDSSSARSACILALSRLGEPGRAKLTALVADPSIAKLADSSGRTFESMVQAALTPQPAGQGRGGGRGGAGGGRGAAPPRQARPDAEFRALVERWIVPAYNGAPPPHAIWETKRGTIELELYSGDVPFGTEQFIRLVESGDIVGTEFTRLVPDFVAQQQAVRNAVTLRDEVNQHGLTRANLSWASAGLDTGRPGYTLGHTPQPHNEGNFTSLGRVVRGMDAVDTLELGDKVTSAKIVR